MNVTLLCTLDQSVIGTAQCAGVVKFSFLWKDAGYVREIWNQCIWQNVSAPSGGGRGWNERCEWMAWMPLFWFCTADCTWWSLITEIIVGHYWHGGSWCDAWKYQFLCCGLSLRSKMERTSVCLSVCGKLSGTRSFVECSWISIQYSFTEGRREIVSLVKIGSVKIVLHRRA